MKNFGIFIFSMLGAVAMFAQAPQAFKYQAVVRDNSNALMANQNIEVRFTIINNAFATEEYIERHNTTTTAYGLISLNVGAGDNIDLGDFTTLNWGGESFSLKVEVDAGSGFEELGTSELLSVPYALYAGTSVGWTQNLNNIYNNNSGYVGIGTMYPRFLLNVVNTTNLAYGTDSVNLIHVPLAIRYNTGLGSEQMTGIGFSISSVPETFGAGIIFQRTGGNSQGKLHFATKASTSVDSLLPIHMTLDHTGKLGIGITSPVTTLTLQQHPFTSFAVPGEAGITFYNHFNTTTGWTIYNSSPYLSFAYNNARVAYVSESTGAWTVTSDKRLKTDITEMEGVLDRVMQLNAVRYRFIDRKNSNTIGFIAQEVLPLFPEVVSRDDDSEESYYGIAYGNMSIIAIKAIQEQQLIIEAQQQQIDDLQRQIDELREMIISQ
jgi:hypothetical protein